MIIHKDFESNCKRIAKFIKKNFYDFAYMSGEMGIDVSEALYNDYMAIGRKEYEKEIQKHLKYFVVRSSEARTDVFDIESHVLWFKLDAIL